MELKLLNVSFRKKRIRNDKQLLFEIKTRLSSSILHSILFLLILFASLSGSAQNCTLNANINKTICANEELLLEGSKGGTFKPPGTTTWTQISGPSTVITSPNSLTTTVTGVLGGNVYIFRLSTTCGDNAIVSDDVEYTVKVTSVANAGPDLGPFCPGTGNLAGNALLAGETGEWTIVSPNDAGIIITDPTSPTAAYTLPTSNTGTSTLRWTVTNTNGCNSFDETIITNVGGLSNISAGPDQVLGSCYSTTQSTTMNASFDGGLRAEIGKWTVVTGPNIPTIIDENLNTTGITNLIEGVYVLRWTVTGRCAFGSDEVQIIVPAPVGNNSTATISPGNTTYCDSRTSIVLTGSSPTFNNEVVTWAQTSGPPATIVSPNSPTTTITGLDGTSSYTFSYTINNSVTGCSSTTTATINYATPAALTITSSSPVIGACDSSDLTIEYTDSGTGSIQYSIISAPAGFSGVPTNYADLGSSPATINGLTEPGSYTVRVRKSANGVGCTDVFQDVTLIVSKTPSPSSGGTNQKLGCGVTSTSLAASVPAVGIGSWHQVRGPNTATIADPFDPLTAISNLVNGLYLLRWEISGGPACTNSQNDVSIRVVTSPPTTADAGVDQTVCANSPVTLSGNILAQNEDGLWTVTPSAGVVFSPDATTRNATVTGLIANNTDYTFTWTISNACGSSADDVIITTNSTQGPVQSNAGDDQCLSNGTTSTTLNGNNPAPGTGLWTVVSGTGTAFTDATLFNTTVTGLSTGNYEFQWTLSNGSCTTSIDTVKITVSDAVSTANAGPDQNICGTSTNLNATTPTVGTGTWAQVSGPIDASISSPNTASTTIIGLIDGSYVFRWTINNECTQSTDDVQINVSTLVPIAPDAGADQSICGNTSVTMAGNDVSPGNGLWSIVSGPNVPSIPNPSSPTTTITGLEAGTYIFRWTSSGGTYCTSLFDEVSVDVTPNSNAGSDQSLCFSDSVSLTGNDGSVGTWTQVGTTPNIATITTTSPSSAIASGLIAGTYTFNYTITPTGTCTPLSDTVDITIFSGVSGANAGPDQVFCGATQFVLNGNNPGSLTGTWAVVSGPTGGSFFPNANTPNAIYINVGSGTYIFSWTIANGTCSSTDEVRIENPAQPSIADAGPDQDQVCLFETTMNANNPIEGIGNWTLVSKPLGAPDPTILNPILYNTTISGLNPLTYPATYVFRWTITNGTCPSTFDDVSITVFQGPSIAYAGTDQNLCDATSTSLNATPPTVGTGLWTQISGPTATIDFPSSPNSTISGLSIGTYEFEWTTTNTVCTLSDRVLIINNPPLTPASTAGH